MELNGNTHIYIYVLSYNHVWCIKHIDIAMSLLRTAPTTHTKTYDKRIWERFLGELDEIGWITYYKL